MCVPLEADAAIPMACLDERHEATDPFCLRHAAEAESPVRGLAQAFQPFRCTDGIAFQFIPRTISGGFWPQVEASDLVLPDVIAMGGLNTSLLVGMQALEATQGALEATSNNIANANTPGYTREVAQFSESPETEINGQVSGGGVSLDGLQSVRDELLNLQIQQQTSLQSSADAQSSALQQIQTYFSSSSGTTSPARCRHFPPASRSCPRIRPVQPRSRASCRQGRILPMHSNSTANGLTSAQTYADGQVTQTVAQINSLTSQIAQLNGQLSQSATSANGGGTIEDQRDQLVQQLSALTGISVTQTGDGETITTGNGTPLVMGGQSFSLQTTTGSDGHAAGTGFERQQHYRIPPGRHNSAGPSRSATRRFPAF